MEEVTAFFVDNCYDFVGLMQVSEILLLPRHSHNQFSC